jgi:hypothetical protein
MQEVGSLCELCGEALQQTPKETSLNGTCKLDSRCCGDTIHCKQQPQSKYNCFESKWQRSFYSSLVSANGGAISGVSRCQGSIREDSEGGQTLDICTRHTSKGLEYKSERQMHTCLIGVNGE